MLARAITLLVVTSLGAAANPLSVQDAAGDAVPHAAVEFRSAAGTALSSTTTDMEGRVSFASRRSGYYQVRIVADGFADSRADVPALFR